MIISKQALSCQMFLSLAFAVILIFLPSLLLTLLSVKPVLYLLFNLLVVVVGARSGLLTGISKPSEYLHHLKDSTGSEKSSRQLSEHANIPPIPWKFVQHMIHSLLVELICSEEVNHSPSLKNATGSERSSSQSSEHANVPPIARKFVQHMINSLPVELIRSEEVNHSPSLKNAPGSERSSSQSSKHANIPPIPCKFGQNMIRSLPVRLIRFDKVTHSPRIFFVGSESYEDEIEVHLHTVDDVDAGKELHTRADEFIAKFHKHLKMQREVSLKKLQDCCLIPF